MRRKLSIEKKTKYQTYIALKKESIKGLIPFLM